MENYFLELNNINVNDKVEKKEGLTYLSWAWAWAEFKKVCPSATYRVIKFDGKPYYHDPETGYMVYTTVEVDGLVHEMWLPVMDSHNQAMKNAPYTVKTKYKEFTVPAATMFDINKAIMRCLVKNLAMFGLGLYIYAGEDLPEEPSDTKAKPPIKGYPTREVMIECAKSHYPGDMIQVLLNTFGVDDIESASNEQLASVWNKYGK